MLIGGTCKMYKISVDEPEETILGNIGLDKRITLKWISEKEFRLVQTRFTYKRIRTNG
jgi:hypothetical protein